VDGCAGWQNNKQHFCVYRCSGKRVFSYLLCTDLVEKGKEETGRQVRRESQNIQEAIEHSTIQLKTGVWDQQLEI